MLSVLPSLVVLALVAIVALYLASSRRSPPDETAGRVAAARALVLAVGVQGAHFAEEAATGLYERLPALFGLPAMPLPIFVIFNVVWLGIWIASVPGLRSARTAAFFAAWFLAVAAVLNLIAHPLLAIAVGGYFPGLVSSPFIGGAGIWLWRRLQRATRPASEPAVR